MKIGEIGVNQLIDGYKIGENTVHLAKNLSFTY